MVLAGLVFLESEKHPTRCDRVDKTIMETRGLLFRSVPTVAENGRDERRAGLRQWIPPGQSRS